MAVADIYDAVLAYDEEQVVALVEREMEAGTDVQVVLREGLVSALDVVGERFSAGVLFVPEMLMAAEAVRAGMDVLRPVLTDTGAKPVGTVVLGTVRGDLHDIGKNLVGMMLEGSGFRVVDLGTDVEAEDFISAAQENEADIVGLSALLTTSMAEMARAVDALRAANRSRNLSVKIMVGGPPVNDEFVARIGADGDGIDAAAAVDTARRLVRRGP